MGFAIPAKRLAGCLKARAAAFSSRFHKNCPGKANDVKNFSNQSLHLQ
jgi:hypothetical protein